MSCWLGGCVEILVNQIDPRRILHPGEADDARMPPFSPAEVTWIVTALSFRAGSGTAFLRALMRTLS